MIEIDIHKNFHSANKPFYLECEARIPKGKITALFGTSGAGKTSLLRIIAGLSKPDAGKLYVGEKAWFDHAKNEYVIPQSRGIGMVFQETALFPNMTVHKNLKFATSSEQNGQHVEELIKQTNIEELLSRNVETLSGGEKQRVALARALVRRPEILLLDEPLSALDFTMRKRLQDLILQLHHQYELTTILVSHDLGELFRLADNILVLDNGKIINQGRPIDILGQKKMSGKFQFTGQILSIDKEDVLYIVSILVENQIIKVAADPNEIKDIKEGEKVIVASKAFNPVIQKIV